MVVVSSTQDHDTIVKALDLGPQGFILKSAERQIMVRALELVFAGGTGNPFVAFLAEIVDKVDFNLERPKVGIGS